MTKLYDITPSITPTLAVFPGDTIPTREILLDMHRGDNITLSTLRTTVHVGAHIDGANHYGKDAPAIDALDLNICIGPCQVMRVDVTRGSCITIEDMNAEIRAPRVLFHTNTYPDPNQWNDDYAGLEPRLVDHLHAHNVKLVGIDTPSVDPAASKELPAHQRFLENDMTILEGIVLDDVPNGMYELIALPLKLAGFDASPVRAVLRTI